MKKIIGLLCCLLCISCGLLLAGCNSGDNEAVDGKDSTEKNGGVSYYVTYKNVKIALGADADAVTSALGEPQSMTENGNCAGLGNQYKYSYPSIDVYVLETADGKATIDQITLRDDLISTPEDVRIGSTVTEAKNALGEPSSSSASSLIYTKGSYNLKLGIKDGAVQTINYINLSE